MGGSKLWVALERGAEGALRRGFVATLALQVGKVQMSLDVARLEPERRPERMLGFARR